MISLSINNLEYAKSLNYFGFTWIHSSYEIFENLAIHINRFKNGSNMHQLNEIYEFNTVFIYTDYQLSDVF